jgi:enoyl-CoA hydratase
MIQVTADGPITTIALDRPAARNAFTIASWDALCAAARAIGDDAHVVILRSSVPGTFCAGADLKEMAALTVDEAARVRFRLAMRAAIEAVASIACPVVVAVDGDCFGAGVALALAGDLIVAGDRARFATTPAKLGIGYPREDVARLAARIGPGQAGRLLYTAEPILADEAAALGLAELRAPDASIAAEACARTIAANAPDALRLLKRTLADPADPALDTPFDEAFGNDAFAKRLAAFQDRPR